MKKTSILLAMVLVFAITMSSFAGMFPDVPEDHWAYEEVQELVSKEIVEGFPDGEFKGDKEFTRYEMAIVTSRLVNLIEEKIDNGTGIDEAIEEVKAEVEALSEGLTDAQAQDVQAIAEALIDEVEFATSEDIEEISANLEGKIKKMEVDLKALQQLGKMRYEDLNEKYDEVKSSINENIEDLNNALNKIETDLKAQKQLGTMRYNDLSDTITSEIEAIQTEIDDNVQTLKKLKTDLQAQKQLSTLRYEDVNETVADKFNGLEADVEEKIQTLTKLKTDLQAQKQLGTMRYNDLKSRIDDVNDNISAIENRSVQFKTPSYDVTYDSVVIEGSGIPYIDPYIGDEDNVYEDTSVFNQKLGIDMLVQTDHFAADFNFAATSEDFFNQGGVSGWAFNDFSADITADNFEATIDEGQVPYIRDYIYGGNEDEDLADGVVAEVYGNTYVLAGRDDGSVVFAGEKTHPFLGNDLNIAYGIENKVVGGENIVLGLDTVLNMGGFAITPEFAVSDNQFEETYFHLNTEGDVGPISTIFNYYRDTGLVPIVAEDFGVDNGYDITGEMDLADLTVKYENYFDLPVFRLSALQTIATIDNEFYYDTFTSESSSRMQYIGEVSRELGNLILTGKLDWINIDTDYVGYEQEYDEDYEEEEDTLDKTLTAEYDIGNLDTKAEFVHDIDGNISQYYWAEYVLMNDNLVTSAELSKDGGPFEHTYKADYAKGLIEVGVAKYINHTEDATDLTAGFNPDKEELYVTPFHAVGLAPYAEFGYRMGDDTYRNYVLGAEAARTLTDRITLNGVLEYADKEFDVEIAGKKLFKSVDLEYEIADNVSANLGYENLDFDGDSASDDYEVRKATGSISVSF